MRASDWRKCPVRQRRTNTQITEHQTLSTFQKWVEEPQKIDYVFNRIEGVFRITDKVSNGVKIGEIRTRIL